jgi:hypothetical protein
MSNQNSWNKGWQAATVNKPVIVKPTQAWQEKQAQQAGWSFGTSQQSQSGGKK